MDYSQWITTLTLDSLTKIGDYYHQNAYFKDPFNEFHGVEKINKIFSEMFHNLERPRFKVQESIANNSSQILIWDFIFVLKNKEYQIHGTTHLKWEHSKIIYHRDYWDVGEEVLAKIPIIKSVYKLLTSKLSVSS